MTGRAKLVSLHGMKIGLVQINMGLTWSTPASSSEAEPPSFGLLPYSVGLLKSYAVANAAGRHEWLVPVYGRVPVAEGAARELPATSAHRVKFGSR